MTTLTTAPTIRHRILVVEDEPIVARDIALQLHELGYEPLGPARSGEQAIALARQLHPDLVLMDIHLTTAMDGIVAAQAIRAQFDVSSVFLSAFEGHETLARAALAKPIGYLPKPFVETELSDALLAAFRKI